MSSSARHHQQSFSSPLDTLHNFSSTWQDKKQSASLPQRLGMRVLGVIALAAAMFIVPTFIHKVVRSLDDVYELLGRRARSPYEAEIPWTSVVIATVLLAGWHVWLGRLSYKTVIEGSDGSAKKEGVSWGRILGRIVLPFLLLSLGLHFAFQLFARITRPAPLVKGNVV